MESLANKAKRNRGNWKNIGVLLGAVLVAFILLESLSRLYFYRYYPQMRQGYTHRMQELLHQKSSVPGLEYEMSPNAEKIVDGLVIRTNSYGMRGKEPTESGSDSVSRIVILGDSHTFGYRVAEEFIFANVLESTLNKSRKAGEREFEVLNLGVIGYDVGEEVTTLRHKGLLWNPEVVVIAYCLNDASTLHLGPLRIHFREFDWWEHSYSLRLAFKVRSEYQIRSLGDGDFRKFTHLESQNSWRSVVKSFHEIKKMARENHFRVLLLIIPDTKDLDSWNPYSYEEIHKQIATAAKGAEFEVIDLRHVFQNYRPSDIWIEESDHHLNELAHGLTAAAIADELGSGSYFTLNLSDPNQ